MAPTSWEFAEAREAFTPATLEVTVCFDGKLVADIERVGDELAVASGADDDAAVERLAHELVALNDRYAAAERTFVFESLGEDAWEDLRFGHKPTEEQAANRLDHNPVTFRPAAIVASCVMPTLTLDDVEWMRKNLAPSQWRRLWLGCEQVHLGSDLVGKALRGTATKLATALSSTTAAREESLTAPSAVDE